MRAGLFLAYWPWFSLEEQLELSVLADELGLDSVWISEAWGQDAVSVLGLLAGRTERVALGSGLREYVEIVRAALAREGGLSYEGEEWTLPHTGGMGLGKPLKLLVRPVQQRIPIYLGAIGPKAVEQTGEIADGWLPFMLDPSRPDVLLDAFDRGLAKAGRTRADIDIAAAVLTDELLDATALATTPEGLEGRLAEYERAGVTTFVAVPCGDQAAVARAVAAAVGTGRAASPDPTPNSDGAASPGSTRAASPQAGRPEAGAGV